MDKRLIAAIVLVVLALILKFNGAEATLLLLGIVAVYIVVGLGTRFLLDKRSPNVVTLMAGFSTLLMLSLVGVIEVFHFTEETLARQYGNVGGVMGVIGFGALAGFWWGCAKTWLDYRNKRAASIGA